MSVDKYIELVETERVLPFARLIATLLEQNLSDAPERAQELRRMRGRVCLFADDLHAALTLEFTAGRVRVHSGVFGLPDLTLRASSELLIDLTRLEVASRWALPDPRGPVVRKLARALLRRQLRIHGFVRALPVALRLSRLMSVSSPAA